ncbi:MAG TPA: peptidoglycan-binding domain-containing protein [Candidatus Paceibacterota bacterium]|nr:peptidoglycan-binding domain-containing protein [Candidatus Paceibacterota bacterium]
MQFFNKHRFLSVAVGVGFAASFLGAAPLAQAATLGTTQIQAIINLLQAFGADSSTIANVQAALENTTPPAQSTTATTTPSGNSIPSSSGTSCAILSNNLTVGSTGSEVSRLQAFLGKDKSIYPEDSVTGYFGPATEAAVQRWQVAQGIVSSGDARTTGYGHVGPMTRGDMNKEMERECENGDVSNGSSSDATASSTSEGNAHVGIGAHCGGFIANAPVCAEGLQCQLGTVADQGGICVQKTDGSNASTSEGLMMRVSTSSSEGN